MNQIITSVIIELVKGLVCLIKNIPDVTAELCDDNKESNYIVISKNNTLKSNKNAKFVLVNNSDKKVTQLFISLKLRGDPDFEFINGNFKDVYIQLPPNSKTIIEMHDLELQDEQKTFARMYVRYRDEAGRDKNGILLKVLKIKFNGDILQRASLQWSEIS